MIEYTEKIKEVAGNLLKSGNVDLIIGYKQGTVPGVNAPCIVKKPEDVRMLVWDSNCRLNLANYVTNRTDKIGIIAKGCDSRNLVNHIIEKRVDRDRLVVIGIPCTGMTDKTKLESIAGGELNSVTESNGQITVKSNGTEKTVGKQEVLQRNCSSCTHRNPVIMDEVIADPVPESGSQVEASEIETIEKMPPEKKWQFFEDMFSTCTRCYACKNACPLCYCPTCFVDESRPQWVGKGDDLIDVRTYHTLRAFHCAGRCTDCGACEAACPMNIRVRLLTGKLEKTCKELYNWTPGLSIDERPALDTFTLNDPEEFIR